MISTNMKGCLVVPNWPASPYWSILQNGLSRKSTTRIEIEELKPFIVTGQGNASVVMTGHTDFSWVAIYVDNCQ